MKLLLLFTFLILYVAAHSGVYAQDQLPCQPNDELEPPCQQNDNVFNDFVNEVGDTIVDVEQDIVKAIVQVFIQATSDYYETSTKYANILDDDINKILDATKNFIDAPNGRSKRSTRQPLSFLENDPDILLDITRFLEQIPSTFDELSDLFKVIIDTIFVDKFEELTRQAQRTASEDVRTFVQGLVAIFQGTKPKRYNYDYNYDRRQRYRIRNDREQRYDDIEDAVDSSKKIVNDVESNHILDDIKDDIKHIMDAAS